MIVGQYYNKLCLVEESWNTLKREEVMWEQDEWMNYNPVYSPDTHYKYYRVIPLIDHPHNDVENGQKEIHYHIDSTFETGNSHYSMTPIRINLPLKENQRLEIRKVKYKGGKETYITPSWAVKNSKLKHKCIHKGKCPHRGYDLSNEEPEYDINYADDIITCPLHGLRFDAKTKELIQ